MSTSLNDFQFSGFIQYLKQTMEGVSVKRAACCKNIVIFVFLVQNYRLTAQ